MRLLESAEGGGASVVGRDGGEEVVELGVGANAGKLERVARGAVVHEEVSDAERFETARESLRRSSGGLLLRSLILDELAGSLGLGVVVETRKTSDPYLHSTPDFAEAVAH